MASSLSITSKDELHCHYHPDKPILLLDTAVGVHQDFVSRLVCSSCLREGRILTGNENLKKIKLSTTDITRCFILSNTDDFNEPPLNLVPKAIERSDFKEAQIEHIIINHDCKGYPPRSLLYIEDVNILISGSESGQTILWNMDSTPIPLQMLDLHSTIRCSIYFKYENVRYLVLGVNKKVKIYTIIDSGCTEKNVIRSDSIINDICCNTSTGRMYVCNWDSEIHIYQAGKFNLLHTINTAKLKINGPLASIFSLNDQEIAVENLSGIFVIDVDEQSCVDKFRIHRRGYGSTYIKEKDQFYLRTQDDDTIVIDRSTMKQVEEYRGRMESETFPAYRYIWNSKSKQIVTNSGGDSLLIYENKQIHTIDLKGYLQLSSGVELMPKIGKIAIGDETNGILLILSINQLDTSRKPQVPTEKEKRADESDKKFEDKTDLIMQALMSQDVERERSRSKSPYFSDLKATSIFKPETKSGKLFVPSISKKKKENKSSSSTIIRKKKFIISDDDEDEDEDVDAESDEKNEVDDEEDDFSLEDSEDSESDEFNFESKLVTKITTPISKQSIDSSAQVKSSQSKQSSHKIMAISLVSSDSNDLSKSIDSNDSDAPLYENPYPGKIYKNGDVIATIGNIRLIKRKMKIKLNLLSSFWKILFKKFNF